MPRRSMAIGILGGMCLVVLQGIACETWARSSSEDLLSSVKEDLMQNKIRSLKVLFLPYHVLTRTRMTPELLEGAAEFNTAVEMNELLRRSLISAIESSHGSDLDSAPDVRWGVLLQDEDGSTLHSIYVSGKSMVGTGRQGIVDGRPVKLDDAMIAWLEGTFPQATTAGRE
jgi:hypothetical protein